MCNWQERADICRNAQQRRRSTAVLLLSRLVSASLLPAAQHTMGWQSILMGQVTVRFLPFTRKTCLNPSPIHRPAPQTRPFGTVALFFLEAVPCSTSENHTMGKKGKGTGSFGAFGHHLGLLLLHQCLSRLRTHV